MGKRMDYKMNHGMIEGMGKRMDNGMEMGIKKKELFFFSIFLRKLVRKLFMEWRRDLFREWFRNGEGNG